MTRFYLKLILLMLCAFPCAPITMAQSGGVIKVHFLYGSKPLKKYSATESRWFGGILGGHVGIEGDNGRILNFNPRGKFHWFARKKDFHSAYALHTHEGFYSIFGQCDSVKSAIVIIPVSTWQKQKFDSISSAYIKNAPYDYAFIGMRCGSATYEILATLEILPAYSYRKTYRKIFYPLKLRKRLLAKAKKNGWEILRTEGSVKRKWERD